MYNPFLSKTHLTRTVMSQYIGYLADKLLMCRTVSIDIQAWTKFNSIQYD